MGLNTHSKKKEQRKNLRDDKLIKNHKSQSKKYKNNSKLSQVTRKRLLQKLKERGVYKINDKHIHLFKTKELVSKYFEVYNLTDEQKADFAKSYGVKENYFDSRFKDHLVYVYLIGNLEYGFVKIGYSNDPNKRLKSLQTGCPFDISILDVFEGGPDVEKSLHKRYRRYSTRGEWFKVEGELKDYIEMAIKKPH